MARNRQNADFKAVGKYVSLAYDGGKLTVVAQTPPPGSGRPSSNGDEYVFSLPRYTQDGSNRMELPLGNGKFLVVGGLWARIESGEQAPAEKVGTGVSCPSCKTLNSADASFCKSCGQRIKDSWRCTCGTWLEGGLFCNKCGTRREDVPNPKASVQEASNVQKEASNDNEGEEAQGVTFDLGEDESSLSEVAEEWYADLREADKPSGPKGKNTLRVRNGGAILETRLLRNLPQELRYALHKGDPEVLPLILEGLTLSGFPKSEKLRAMLTDEDLCTLFKEAFPL